MKSGNEKVVKRKIIIDRPKNQCLSLYDQATRKYCLRHELNLYSATWKLNPSESSVQTAKMASAFCGLCY